MNEPARPTAAWSVSTPPGPIVHVPHTSGLIRDGHSRVHQPGCYITSRGKHSPAFARLPGSYLDPRDNPPASAESRTPPRATRSHVPRSQRLRRRRFAPITRTTDDPVSRSASLPLTASHPRVGAGNVSRPLLRCRSGDPATDPHSGTRDSLPSLWPLCGQRLRRGPGAFGASGSAASVSRPIYRVLCRVYIPLSTLPILLSVQRVACLPNRLASSRRG